MAKIDLKFLDSIDNSWISVNVDNNYEGKNVIMIKVYSPYTSDVTDIVLDKSTAIKFAKTLRTEINKIQ